MDAEADPRRLFATIAAGDRAAPHAVHERQSVRLFGVASAIVSNGQGRGGTGCLFAVGTPHSVTLETGTVIGTGPVTGLPGAEVTDIAAMR